MTGLGRRRLDFADPPHDYVLGHGVLAGVGPLVREVLDPSPVALVTDSGVAATGLVEIVADSLKEAGFSVTVVEVPDGEAAKTLAEAERVWSRFSEAGMERRSPVVALGGGAVGDLAGFCAATWHRGVPLVQVPTTLLAMADSAVGGKAAVNLPGGKNLVGAFHLPSLVVADLAVLDTLADREIRSGCAEIVKCAMLEGRRSLDDLAADAPAILSRERQPLARAVHLAVGVKADHVRGDLHDLGGVRALLNLGHTTAHALETASGHGQMRHGEAVAVGLVVATRIAAARGLCESELTAQVIRVLSAFRLPTAVPDGLDRDVLVALTLRDKKTVSGVRRMVLPLRGGGAELAHVGDDELRAALVHTS